MHTSRDSRMPRNNGRLIDRVGEFVSREQHRKALDYLSKFIEDTVPLFGSEPWVLEERHLAWLYRIELLREWGKVTEALAWACLEVELNPKNVPAIAMKEKLKRLAWPSSEKNTFPIASQTSSISPTLWTGVAGMRELKAMLERDVILPLQEPEIYEVYGLDIPNGILLYGPPGCGKTFIARKLADIIGFAFREIKPGDLGSIYVHGTQEKIAALFAEARKKAPSMIFFDEFEAMAPKRDSDSVGHHYASEVNEFLVQLNECGKKGILVVGATNLPDKIDTAVLRPGRIDKKFFVGPPDYEARIELLRLNIAHRPQEKIEWHRCALELENYTCAEIEYLVDESARHALEKNRVINTGDILYAAGKNPPAYTSEMIEKMRKF